MQKFSVTKIIKNTLPLALGGFLVWYLFKVIPPQKLLEYFKNANYEWVFLSVLLGVLSHLSRAYRWKYLLEAMGYKTKLTNRFLTTLIGYLVNFALPRAGEISRATLFNSYEKVPFEKAFGTIIAERLADLLMITIIILIALLIQFDFIYGFIYKNFNPFNFFLIITATSISFFVFVRYIKKANSKFALKIKKIISNLSEGITSIFKTKNKWQFILHTIFIWLMYIAMFWAAIPAIDTLKVPFGAVLISFISGSFAIAATNGGIGAYPAMVGGALTLFGVAKKTAFAFGAIMWASQTSMIIVLGAISFLILPIYNRNR